MKQASYKFKSLFAMLYITVMLSCLILVHKPVQIGAFTTSTAATVFPLWFVMGDIIAEIYGYSASRQMLWCALIAQFVFCIIISVFVHVPSPSSWLGQEHYTYLVHGFFRIYFSVVIGVIISGFLNIYFITKWKILLRGKYFWMRSIGASGIGELTYTIIVSLLVFAGTMSFAKLVEYTVISYLFKFIYTVVLAFPANLISNLLKRIEVVSLDEQGINFNPFKFD